MNITGTHGDFIGKFKDSNLWHRIPAENITDATQKFIKNTSYTENDVIIKKYLKQ